MSRNVIDEAIDGIAGMLDPEFVSAVSREINRQAERCRRTGDHTWLPTAHGRRKCFWCNLVEASGA